MLTKQQLNQLYQYSYSLTLNSDDAYDLLQTGLEKYLKKSSQNIQREMAYIRQIIRNQFIDNQRRSNIIAFETIENNDTLAIDTLSLDDLMIAQDQVTIIWDIMNTSEREIIYLWAVEGYSAKQISDETGVSRGTILSKIHRLREKVIAKFTKLDAAGANL
ncbi:MAG: sigma-70 family RNA polymerase sigma factor [Alcanivoracaceae bacterium]|nr:sigma-70 family RNA polymerase sigma factor [Alcanivoracaceae bacterium]